MSADRLREAARVLRERAKRVIARQGSIDIFVDYYKIRSTTSGHLGIDAAYIATVHPGVGLALADWLDYAAATLPACDCQWPHEPFAVADLILGGAR